MIVSSARSHGRNCSSCPGCFAPGNVLVPFAGGIKVKHVEAEGFHLLYIWSFKENRLFA